MQEEVGGDGGGIWIWAAEVALCAAFLSHGLVIQVIYISTFTT